MNNFNTNFEKSFIDSCGFSLNGALEREQGNYFKFIFS